jgi:tetratricopeptide (TPR) repeat protein
MVRKSLGAALLAAAIAVGGPVVAQPAGQVQSGITLTPAERTALLPLKQAVDARDWTTAASLVPTSRAAVRSDSARYVVGRLQLDMAIATQNRAAQSEALIALLNNRTPSPQERADLLRRYAALAFDAGNFNGADGSLRSALELAPNDPETLSMLVQVSRTRNNEAQALTYLQRAVRAAAASRRPLPESRYKMGLAMAEQAGQRALALEVAREFIAAYPTPPNWRDVLIVFRTVGTVDPAQVLDAMRLMRAAGALTGERDYVAVATALDQAGLPAEAKAVIDEGVERRHVTASDAVPRALVTGANPRIARERTGLAGQIAQARAATATATQARTVADTLLSHGRYADAAELYRVALTRVGEDPGLLNTRLGIALAMAGQRAEAEAALQAVTGPHADLAALWAIWVARRNA